jgi:Ca-activated chloride channel family protein
LLEEMARITKGQFFRTRSPQDLQNVYSSIDLMEKTVITSNSVRRTLELYFWLLDAAFCLLVLEMLLRWGPLRVITV